MNLESFSALDEEITKEDWERTPESVRRFLRWLLESFAERLTELEEDQALSRIADELSAESVKRGSTRRAVKQAEARCSFCGKLRHDIAKMIAGPNVNICNECIEICNEILADDSARDSR